VVGVACLVLEGAFEVVSVDVEEVVLHLEVHVEVVC
jgi:hypothetical protein